MLGIFHGRDCIWPDLGYIYRAMSKHEELARALHQLAERIELGEQKVEPELREAIAISIERHPETAEELSDDLRDWHVAELERREQEDAGTEEDVDLVM